MRTDNNDLFSNQTNRDGFLIRQEKYARQPTKYSASADNTNLHYDTKRKIPFLRLDDAGDAASIKNRIRVRNGDTNIAEHRQPTNTLKLRAIN